MPQWTETNGTWGVAIGTAFLAIFTFVLALGILIQFRSFIKEAKFQSYKQLDDIYCDIQKLIISNPHLVTFNADKTPDQIVQYDAFAFIVWNFLESIYDYIEEEKDRGVRGEGKGSLQETWGVIIKYEGRLHKDWFLDQEHKGKFKHRFYSDARDNIIDG